MKHEHQYYVYILTTAGNSVLYTGVTNDLIRRVYEHKNNLVPGFTKRYNVHKLVYFETGEDIVAAIEREKQIKSLDRKKKIAMIDVFNPDWHELYDEILGN
jgi:putative endonuclease